MKQFRLSLLALLGFLGVANAQDYTGKVGINTNTPTETLEINGTAKINNLPTDKSPNALYNGSANKTTSFLATKTVVMDNNGNLGVVNGLPEISKEKRGTTLLTHFSHTPTGLKFNTRNDGVEGKSGVMGELARYRIFGSYSSIPGATASNTANGYTKTATTFTGTANTTIKMTADLAFGISKNRVNNAPLDNTQASLEGDRLLVVFLELYKGNEFVASAKKLINLKPASKTITVTQPEYSRDSDTTDANSHYNSNIALVPTTTTTTTTAAQQNYWEESLSFEHTLTETANNYSINLTVMALAPKNGQFRMNFEFPHNIYVEQVD